MSVIILYETIRCLECGKRYSWEEFLKLDIKQEFKGKTIWEVTAQCSCGEFLTDKRVITCRNCKYYNRKEECIYSDKVPGNIISCWAEKI